MNNLTDEQIEWEFECANRLAGIPNKNSGMIVETKSGLVGRTKNVDSYVNGKVKVYTDKGNLLCDPTTLKQIGFID